MAPGPFLENVAIITGASRGIGEALAYQMAEQGAWLALGARDGDRLQAVAEKCCALGGRAIAIPTDVTDADQCRGLVEQTVTAYRRIDTLVNNAGITMWSPFDQVEDLSIFGKIMDVNYLGSVYCTYYALPYLQKTQGRIVAISSMTGKAGVPTRSGYAASKHAMVGFFDTLRIEQAKHGISVTLVYPDFVKTETRKNGFGGNGHSVGKSHIQEDKVMSAEECARLTLLATAQRKREEVMSLRGKLGQWLKLIAPGLVDRIAERAIRNGH